MERFDIYIRSFAAAAEPAKERLARAFGLKVERAAELIASLPRVVKRGVPADQVERYARMLREIGAVHELRRSPISPSQVIAIGALGGADEQDSAETHGSALSLPPPEPEPSPLPRAEGAAARFAGTIVLGAAPGSTSSASSSDTLVEGRAAPPPQAARSPERVLDPPPGYGPHDTVVDPMPRGLLEGTDTGATLSAGSPAPTRTAWSSAYGALEGIEPRGEPRVEPRFEDGAPDARVLQVHAPTVPSFGTMPETPLQAAAPQVAPLVGKSPARPPEWTQAEGSASSPGFGVLPLSVAPPGMAPLELDVRGPVRSPARLSPRAGLSVPVPAPVSERPPAPLPPAPPPAPQNTAAAGVGPGATPRVLSEVWQGIAPRASPAPERLAADPQLFGAEAHAELAAHGQDGSELTAGAPLRREQALGVVAPGMWEGRPMRASQRPAAAPPPSALHTALRPSQRPPASAPTSTLSTALPITTTASELPAFLRWALRIGIGVSLFVLLATLRQCRMLDTDVEKALARWEARPSAVAAVAGEAAAPSVPAPPQAALGPVASEWMSSDFHQFSNGDKERVRTLVQRFEAAGAPAVYIGTITEMGTMKIGGELLVAMPADASRRAAVLAVHEAFLRATFGGFAPATDPEVSVLHVTL